MAELAENLIGKRFTAEGTLESVSALDPNKLRGELATLPREAELTQWLEWFFADRSSRSIAPRSQLGLADYIRARTLENDPNAWREALMLCPTNGAAFARFADYISS